MASAVPISCNCSAGSRASSGVVGGQDAVDERLDRSQVGTAQRNGARRARAVRPFLDNRRKDELVTMAGDRANKPRCAGIVLQRTSQRPDRLRQRTVGDNDIAPHLYEDRFDRYRLLPLSNQQQQQIEVAGDQRARRDHRAAARADARRPRTCRSGIASVSRVPVARRGGASSARQRLARCAQQGLGHAPPLRIKGVGGLRLSGATVPIYRALPRSPSTR